MTFKTLTPLFVLPAVPVVAIAVALSTAATSVSAFSERNKPLHVLKDCSKYSGNAGEFCEIKSSNLGRIPFNARVYYDQPQNVPAGLLDSNVVLDAGHGSRALGRCTVDLNTGDGLCTFSDGTGQFAGFSARVMVSPPSSPEDYWHWEGTYSFNPND